MVTTIATSRGDVKVAYQAQEGLTHVIFSTGTHSLAFTFTDEQGDALCDAVRHGHSLAAAPPDDARTVYQWKSQLANWMSDYTIQSNLKNIHHPGDRANVAWFLACKLTGTPVTGLDSGGDNSPDDDAVTRVLEAAAQLRTAAEVYSMIRDRDTVDELDEAMNAYDAAVSALREREGK